MPKSYPLHRARPEPTASASGPPAARRCCFSCRATTVAMLDAIKERQGLRNRSQALLQLIEQKEGSRPADDLKMRKPALPGGL